jgi:prepilin-type N-terminal cleavage/methylation domain-containing protein
MDSAYTKTCSEGLLSYQNNKLAGGFTLIETLVAISIFSLALTAFITAARFNIIATASAKNEVIALYLAQDALEYVKSKINDRLINSVMPFDHWLKNGFDKCINEPNGCWIDTRLDSSFPISTNEYVTVCGGGVCPVLQYNTVTHQYGYGGGASWVNTHFRRRVLMTEHDLYGDFIQTGTEEVAVTVIVEWPSGFGTQNVALRANFYRN